MPKVVDHAERREELAAALWRVVVREGIDSASIRHVAAEAGWSTGSLRHYFDSQSDLLAFAMELVVQRVSERLRALPADPDPRGRAAALLHELLPLDEDRRTETRVWLAFTTRALVEPDLRELRDRAHVGMRALCTHIVNALGAAEERREAELLHALIDGLALHAILASEVTTPARQVEILTAHLGMLGEDASRLRLDQRQA